MGQVFYFLFSTGGAIVLLSLLALWVWSRPKSELARRVLLAVAAFYAVASIYVFPAAVADLATRAYHRFEPADLPPGGDVAVVLLGAGGRTVAGWDDRLPVMTPMQASRVLEAWRVFRAIAPKWIISSGGSPLDPAYETPSGITLRDELAKLGVPRERILVETMSLDTHGEAVIVVPMLKSLGVDRVVLVTSDIHMPRALGAFRAQGLSMVPAIAPDPGRATSRFDRYVPSANNLAFTGLVVHELVGLPYYWIRGWWKP